MITLLHGSDELLRSEHLSTIRAALGPAELAELNTTWLDGRKTSTAEISHHCDVVPFLTPRRLVIVEGLLTHLAKRTRPGKNDAAGDGRDSSLADHPEASPGPPPVDQERQALLDYLPSIPATTDLALIEAVDIASNDPVYRLLVALSGQGTAEIVLCQAPDAHDLPDWIVRRTKGKQADIQRPAAQELATYIGSNLRLLDNELDKLVAYRAGQGPISRDDVRLLVPYVQEANIFDLVDAVGRRDGPAALRLLRELRASGAAPLYLLSMIVRQFRILVQVSDLMGQGMAKDAIAKTIGLHPYPTQKAMQQSRHWRIADLVAIYDLLLQADLAIKTGKLPDDLAVELLVVDLTHRS